MRGHGRIGRGCARACCAGAVLAWCALAASQAGEAPRPGDDAASGVQRERAVQPMGVQALPQGAVKARPERADAAVRSAARQQLLRVPLDVEGRAADPGAAEAVRLTAGAGRITSAASGAPVLEMAAGGSVIVSSEAGRASAARTLVRQGVKTPMPWLVVEAERTASGPELRTARPFLMLAKAIAWNAEQRRHIAEFLFGLDPEQGEPGPLGNAMVVRFTVTCDDVAPSSARVERVGPAGYDTVRVACSREVKNERAEHHIQVHAGHGNLRYPFEIPRRPGPPLLSATATEVPGFGFGTTRLTVRNVEIDGSALLADRDLPVTLVVEGGSIHPSELTIARGTDAVSAEVHPHGVGTIAVFAQVGARTSEPVSIELTWPVLPVSAMIAGGLLGGTLSAFGPRKRKLRRRAIEGVLVGLVVTGVVLVLPSFATIPAWARTTELGLFVLAAIAGFAGTPLVDRAARAVFPALAKADRA